MTKTSKNLLIGFAVYMAYFVLAALCGSPKWMIFLGVWIGLAFIVFGLLFVVYYACSAYEHGSSDTPLLSPLEFLWCLLKCCWCLIKFCWWIIEQLMIIFLYCSREKEEKKPYKPYL